MAAADGGRESGLCDGGRKAIGEIVAKGEAG